MRDVVRQPQKDIEVIMQLRSSNPVERKYNYATVSEAIKELALEGYTTDFNLKENLTAFQSGKFNADKFEIMKIYRYEGDSDPADEATVYAIQSTNGVKGILVTGYGMYSDPISTAILNTIAKAKV